MRKRPQAVIQTAQVLFVDAVVFFLGSILMFVLMLITHSESAVMTYRVLFIVTLLTATMYLVLAYGFYNLRAWAYTLVRYLVRIDRLSIMARLSKKIESQEVRDAFGLGGEMGKDQNP